jgi:hypothetical protein
MRRRALIALALLPAVSRAQTAAAFDVAGFRARRPAAGPVMLVGYVVQVRPCPPCPRDAQCKPCQGDLIELADDPAAPDAPVLAVLMPAAALVQFQAGRRYRLFVEVRPAGGGSLHLRSAEPLP